MRLRLVSRLGIAGSGSRRARSGRFGSRWLATGVRRASGGAGVHISAAQFLQGPRPQAPGPVADVALAAAAARSSNLLPVSRRRGDVVRETAAAGDLGYMGRAFKVQCRLGES